MAYRLVDRFSDLFISFLQLNVNYPLDGCNIKDVLSLMRERLSSGLLHLNANISFTKEEMHTNKLAELHRKHNRPFVMVYFYHPLEQYLGVICNYTMKPGCTSKFTYSQTVNEQTHPVRTTGVYPFTVEET